MGKIASEKQSRTQLIGWARKYGCEAELLKIFNRYDDALKGCKSNEEIKVIQAMGIIEINNFFGAVALDIRHSDRTSTIIDENNKIVKDK